MSNFIDRIDKITKYINKLNISINNNDIKKTNDYLLHLKYYNQTGGAKERNELNKTIKVFNDVLAKIEGGSDFYTMEVITNNLKKHENDLKIANEKIALLEQELANLKTNNENKSLKNEIEKLKEEMIKHIKEEQERLNGIKKNISSSTPDKVPSKPANVSSTPEKITSTPEKITSTPEKGLSTLVTPLKGESKNLDKFDQEIANLESGINNITEIPGITESSNADQNANNIVSVLEKKNLPSDISKELTQTQTGGNDAINNMLLKLDELYKIYNSEKLLKIIGLISEKELFTNLYEYVFLNSKKISEDIDNEKKLFSFLNLFFIDIDTYPEFINQFNLDGLNIKNMIERDTYIYKLYDTQNTVRKLFAYTVIYLLNKKVNIEKSTIFFTNMKTSIEITNIILILFNKIKIVLSRYNDIKSQNEKISNLYSELIKRKRKVFGFIKIRNDSYNDTRTINPRYKYKIQSNQSNKDKYLALRYYNVDGRYDFGQNIMEAKKNLKDDLETKKNKKEYYYFGPFDGIYETTKNNKDVADDSSKTILDKLIENDQDICVIGYGQSGSGKTSTLIYLNTPQKTEDGILVEICNSNKFTDTFHGIELKMVNLYVNHGSGISNMNQIKDEHYKYNLIEIDNDSKPRFILNENNKWIYEKDTDQSIQRGIGKFISDAFEKREVEPTPNNPNSSRSHVIVCLTLIKKPNSQNKRGGAKNEEWTESIDPGTGHKYWYNSKTGESTWEDPNKGESTSNDSNTGEWTEMTDPGSGHKYWYNSRTGESTWEDPNKRESNSNDSNTGEWTEMTDPGSGHKYWYNSKTGESSWEDPNKRESTWKDTNIEKINWNDPNSRKLVVCDLAGVENVFDCENPEEIIKFDQRYQVSDKYNKDKNNTKEIQFDRYFCEQQEERKIAKENGTRINFIPTDESLKCINEINNGCSTKELKLADKHKGKLENITNRTVEKDQNLTEDEKFELELCQGFEKFNKDNYNKYTNFIQKKWNEIIKDEKKKNAFFSFNEKYLSITKPTRLPKIDEVAGIIVSSREFKNLFAFGIDNIINRKKQLESKKATMKSKNENTTSENKVWECDEDRLKKLIYNCKLRRNEGYMINRSLGDMRNDIKMLIKRSLLLNPEQNNFLPLFYEKEIYPYCRNININDEYFEDFYKFEKKQDSGLSGVLLKIMSGKIEKDPRNFGLNIDSMTFIIFTVINLTDNGKVNNPPNPPFINSNDLIYYLKIDKNQQKLIDATNEILDRIIKYDFYLNNLAMKKLIDQRANGIKYDMIESYAEAIIKVLDENNPSTLIGSIVSTDILLNTVYNKLVCSKNENLDNLLTRYANKTLDTGNIENIIKELDQD